MWPNVQFPTDLVTFTEEILNGKLNFFVKCVIGHYSASDYSVVNCKYTFSNFWNSKIENSIKKIVQEINVSGTTM